MGSILELVAVAGAVLAFVFALFMAWGLSELGGAGRLVMADQLLARRAGSE
jgi:high-affinity Fe2+/Pb2+ permease